MLDIIKAFAVVAGTFLSVFLALKFLGEAVIPGLILITLVMVLIFIKTDN